MFFPHQRLFRPALRAGQRALGPRLSAGLPGTGLEAQEGSQLYFQRVEILTQKVQILRYVYGGRKIVLFVLLSLIVASSEALFFGVPRSSCRYDNQCRLRKCVNRGNIFCGAGSKF